MLHKLFLNIELHNFLAQWDRTYCRYSSHLILLLILGMSTTVEFFHKPETFPTIILLIIPFFYQVYWVFKLLGKTLSKGINGISDLFPVLLFIMQILYYSQNNYYSTNIFWSYSVIIPLLSSIFSPILLLLLSLANLLTVIFFTVN